MAFRKFGNADSLGTIEIPNVDTTSTESPVRTTETTQPSPKVDTKSSGVLDAPTNPHE